MRQINSCCEVWLGYVCIPLGFSLSYLSIPFHKNCRSLTGFKNNQGSHLLNFKDKYCEPSLQLWWNIKHCSSKEVLKIICPFWPILFINKIYPVELIRNAWWNKSAVYSPKIPSFGKWVSQKGNNQVPFHPQVCTIYPERRQKMFEAAPSIRASKKKKNKKLPCWDDIPMVSYIWQNIISSFWIATAACGVWSVQSPATPPSMCWAGAAGSSP